MQTKSMVSLFFILVQAVSVLKLAVGLPLKPIAIPICQDNCGGVWIPYPFGIGANCYHDRSYEIICNASFGTHKPILRQFDLEVVDINWPGRYSRRDPKSEATDAIGQTLTVALPSPNLCGSDDGDKTIPRYDLKDSPYHFSGSNVLLMEGCGGSIVLRQRNGVILAGCASICGVDNMNGTSCYGVGCCQASIETSFDYYEIDVRFEKLMKSNSCNASVALIDSSSIASKWNFPRSLSSLKTIPTTLEWDTSFVLENRTVHYNVSCADFTCYCQFPYEGNPYLPYGCQVMEECRHCKSRCDYQINNTGSSYHYDYLYCQKPLLLRRGSFLGFIIGIGVVLLFLGSYWLNKYLKRRKEIKKKAEHFKRNGGLLLQQQMSSDEGVVERTKLFTVTELEKATDFFNENRILGQGGQGTVYKGMLMDGKIVAIKKSKKVDESQVEQFVNEVVIVSQINHRNVVKLLGCCLETEVPVLVYEYIPNGTLYEHLHGLTEEFHVNWKMRLKIASESAGAVAYLHSSSSAPIYHRDIKSTNILLDEKYRAKVSDFGTSKSITIEQTHVTTAVLGTYGYMDPEYFQSNQFTEKSDVYSFGVVLVELITGKKPICPTADGGWINLACDFLTQMEDSSLFEMIDARIKEEGMEEEFRAVAELARKCLNMNGKQRPTMKEIAVQLDGIRSSNMRIQEEPRPAENNHIVTELIYSDGGPFSKTSFSAADDPPVYSIEVQPLMAST